MQQEVVSDRSFQSASVMALRSCLSGSDVAPLLGMDLL